MQEVQERSTGITILENMSVRSAGLSVFEGIKQSFWSLLMI